MDSPTLTARRTAAVSILGIRALARTLPARIVLIDTGQQAGQHALAIAGVWPDAEIGMCGRSVESTRRFVERLQPFAPRLSLAGHDDNADVVITLTTSKTPVYHAAARAGRLVIGVGAFTPEMDEIEPDVIRASSVFVDDPHGAGYEAGDLIRAEMDWSTVRTLADALHAPPDGKRPLVFKSVGTAAWDLAACRVIHARLG